MTNEALQNQDSGMDQEQQQPQLAKVKLGDSEFEVPAAVAEALNRQRELESRLNDTQSQYEQLVSQVRDRLTPKEEPKEPERITGDLLWQDPDKFVRLLTEQIQNATKSVQQDLTQNYERAKTWETFWASFWSENKDLDPKQDAQLVEAILTSNSDRWGNLPIVEAQKKLAEETRKTIASYLARNKKDVENDPDLHVEGGALGSAFVRTGGGDKEKVTTLSDVIKRRREARFKRHQ